jgi:hypothetical protein
VPTISVNTAQLLTFAAALRRTETDLRSTQEAARRVNHSLHLNHNDRVVQPTHVHLDQAEKRLGLARKIVVEQRKTAESFLARVDRLDSGPSWRSVLGNPVNVLAGAGRAVQHTLAAPLRVLAEVPSAVSTVGGSRFRVLNATAHFSVPFLAPSPIPLLLWRKAVAPADPSVWFYAAPQYQVFKAAVEGMAHLATPRWKPLPPLAAIPPAVPITFAPDGRSIVADVYRDFKSDSMNSGPPEGHIRIIETSTVPPRLVIVLAGVEDLSSTKDAAVAEAKRVAPLMPIFPALSPILVGRRVLQEVIDRPERNPRDLAVATPQHFVNGGDYVESVKQRVTEYMALRGLATPTEVIVVGHSHGAITAVDLAADKSFNGGLVVVTHVIAAGGGQAGDLDQPRRGTAVLAVTNTDDLVSRVIYNTDLSPADKLRRLEPDRFEYRASDGSTKGDLGHDTPHYVKIVEAMDGRAKQFVDDATAGLAGTEALTTDLSVLRPAG